MKTLIILILLPIIPLLVYSRLQAEAVSAKPKYTIESLKDDANSSYKVRENFKDLYANKQSIANAMTTDTTQTITGSKTLSGTTTISGTINITGKIYPTSGSSLPTTGYDEGSLYYNTTTHTLYVATQTVVSTYSWKAVY